MRKNRPGIRPCKLTAALLSLLLLSAAVFCQEEHDGRKERSSRFQERVRAISSGAGSAERRQAILSQLSGMNFDYSLQDFRDGELSGINIRVAFQVREAGRKTILLGAHYDKALLGKGAVDNASGVSAVLELLEFFRNRPLKASRLEAVFFDGEEEGMKGSKAFLRKTGRKDLPAIFLNFDVFGYGDMLWIMSRNARSEASRAIRRAADRNGFPIRITSEYPASDHRPFVAAGIETLGLALLDGTDMEPLLRGRRPENPRRESLLQVLHSSADTPERISPQDAGRALTLVEEAIRYLDEANQDRGLPVPEGAAQIPSRTSTQPKGSASSPY